MTTTILPAPEAVTTAVEGTCDPRFSRVRDDSLADLR